MKKFLTYIVSSLLLFSCSPDQPISQLETTPDIIVSCDFKALRKAQKCVVNNNVKVNTKPKKGGFSLETKKKNTLLGKKMVDFFWVNKKESKVLMSKIITLQEVLKAQKLIGLTNVLRVVSSNSIWNDVVIPGVKDTETISFACKLCASLHTTVPTTFSTKPVISVFVGLKL